MSQNEIYGPLLKGLFGHDVLYDTDPKRCQQQFQHLIYGLRAARLKAYVPLIEKEVRDFLESWGQSVSKGDDWRQCLGTVVVLSA